MSGTSSTGGGQQCEVALPVPKAPSCPSTGNANLVRNDEVLAARLLSDESADGSIKPLVNLRAPPRRDSHPNANVNLLRKTFYRDPSNDTTTTVETNDSNFRNSAFSNSNFSIDLSLSRSNSAGFDDKSLSPSAFVKLPPINAKTALASDSNDVLKENLFEKIDKSGNSKSTSLLPILYLPSLDLPEIVIPESHVSTPRTSRVSPAQKQLLRTTSPTDLHANSQNELVTPRNALIQRYKSDHTISREDFEIE